MAEKFLKLALLVGILLAGFAFQGASSMCTDGSCSCGENVNQDVSLGDSLRNCGSNGLKIVSDDVVLDCRGRSINSLYAESAGLKASNVDNITVKNCRVSNFHSAISFQNVSNSMIKNNSLNQNTATGITLESSDNNRIIQNQANGNWDGIFLQDSSNNTLKNNTASENSINGIHLFYDSQENKVVQNNLSRNRGHGIAPAECRNSVKDNIAGKGKPILYESSAEDIAVSDTSEYSEIIFCNVNSSLIRNVTISNGQERSDGILMVNSRDNKVEKSRFENVRTAVYLFRRSNNNVIIGNKINSSDLGVRIRRYSENNLVKNNKIKNTESYLKTVKSEKNRFYTNQLEKSIVSLNYTGDIDIGHWNSSLQYSDNVTRIRKHKPSSDGKLFLIVVALLLMLLIAVIYRRDYVKIN